MKVTGEDDRQSRDEVLRLGLRTVMVIDVVEDLVLKVVGCKETNHKGGGFKVENCGKSDSKGW